MTVNINPLDRQIRPINLINTHYKYFLLQIIHNISGFGKKGNICSVNAASPNSAQKHTQLKYILPQFLSEFFWFLKEGQYTAFNAASF